MASRSLLTCLFCAVVLTAARAAAGGPDFEPSEAETRQAQRLAATFRRDDPARALRALCRAEPRTPEREAASMVMVERAATVLPRLLDAMDERGECPQEASRVVLAAVCSGRSDHDVYELERRTEKAIGQSRLGAQRALLSALEKPGPRRRAAVQILLAARPSGVEAFEGCDARLELVRRATPSLVEMLAKKDQEDEVLATLAAGGGEPGAAAPAVRPYLTDPRRLPLAVMALGRMGEDASPFVGPLSELLEGDDGSVVLEALWSLGPRAQSALPRLAALSKRIDATCTRPVDALLLVHTISALATRPEDAGLASAALAPLLSCASAPTATALQRLGADGRKVLLSFLRDETNLLRNRLDVAAALQQGNATLSREDGALVELLHAKAGRHSRPVPQSWVAESEEVDPISAASEEVTACRAEVGLSAVAVTGASEQQANTLRFCLANSLCGPARATFLSTLDRCCGKAFGAQRPAFCRP